MKSFLLKALMLSTALGVCATAGADPRIIETWSCDIEDGKTMDDARAANSKWVKFVNAHVEGGDIASSIVTSIVGNAKPGHFLYVDSFPSLASWSVAKNALEGDEEGQAIEAELDAAASCTDNRLYSSEDS